ncbi:MAG TPA: sugar ABC transporter permease, partial [Phototrophicaceae bacterium]|nr:sugar ABC transporter permease [Phototrophicaceae bacterium]
MLRREQQPAASAAFVYRLQIEIVASLFVILGIGLLVALGFSVATNPEMKIGELEFARVVWRFLQNFGVLRPLLIITASFLLIRLGLRLRTRYIGAARWASSILIWLLLLIGVGGLQSFFVGLDAELTNPGSIPNGLIATMPWVLLLAVFGAAYFMLKNSLRFYLGDESIHEQSARRAWNLLVPTLAVFIVVAISPLEQVFISSLTDERFASSEVSQFVGLDNYTQLLGLRIDSLECEKNDDGSCMTEDIDGVTSIIYPNPRGVLGDEYRELRYREWTSFDLNGLHYVVSARDREFMDSMVTSVIYTVAAITLQLILGMFIAMILTSRIRGGGYLRLAMLVPLAIPTLIATQFWDVMFTEDTTGVINSILMSLHLIKEPQAWLLNPSLQIPAVVLVIVWKETPGM